MNVDFLTLACLRDRLDGILGARVQRVVLPDEHSVGMELYAGKRFHLLASASAQHPRIHLVPERLRRGVETPTPLLQLLRKWVRGAHLVDVTQPPWERILNLHFDGPEGASRLIVETIGRYSNVILVSDEGVVMEAVKRVGPDMNRYRVTLPAHPYKLPPPPPGRRPPVPASPERWAETLAGADPERKLPSLLVRTLLAVGPMAAQEIAARATGDPQAPVSAATPEGVAAAVEALFAPLENGRWAPHVALNDEDEVVAFAAYAPQQFESIAPIPTISEGMARYFARKVSADRYAAVRERVQAQLDAARKRVDNALDHLSSQRVDEDEIQALREAGELLLTYQHEVPPRADEVTLTDYAGEPRQIELDPALSPVENAQAYFRRYEKAQRTAKRVPRRMRVLSVDRAYLDQLASDLAMAESRPEIDAVYEALVEGEWVPKKRRSSSGRPQGPRRFEIDGFLILVGRNARQNDDVTFNQAGPHDLWLHARGMPGAHVIIKRGKQEVPERVIQFAAALAATYSPARGDTAAVDVTERRFVRRISGSRPGLVTYRDERTIQAEGRLPEELKES